MPKRPLALLLLGGIVLPCAWAGSLKDSFGASVLGIAWGTSLSNVVGVYPQGDNVFALTPGCRAYWVKDGQTFLGVPRELNGALFGFDKLNHMIVAVVAFPFERKDELRTTLTSLLGTPQVATTLPVGATRYGWRSSDGFAASVTEFGDASQRMIWLTIAAPGYTRTMQCL